MNWVDPRVLVQKNRATRFAVAQASGTVVVCPGRLQTEHAQRLGCHGMRLGRQLVLDGCVWDARMVPGNPQTENAMRLGRQRRSWETSNRARCAYGTLGVFPHVLRWKDLQFQIWTAEEIGFRPRDCGGKRRDADLRLIGGEDEIPARNQDYSGCPRGSAFENLQDSRTVRTDADGDVAGGDVGRYAFAGCHCGFLPPPP
ncbi:hypothetical protein L1987_10791 [Smallanthus sonchifolius]|uniref:Uncharacterized protein n=1 Tax=Smallanthus sonchifolius TaxID=185202 RepID=A0ACB9J9P7_9ASTR|nr:hypothetical protein L1987_10791 [Smallanthus sonchifolius]